MGNDSWIAAKSKDLMKHPDPDNPVLFAKYSGDVTPDVAEKLAYIENQYDPNWKPKHGDYDNSQDPYRAEDLDRYTKIARLNGSPRFSTAVRDGNNSVLSHGTGSIEKSNSMNDAMFYEKFRGWLTRTASVTYIAANMGYGKTDFALLMAALWSSAKQNDADDVKPVVASNIKSCPQAKDITTQPDLAEWMKDRGEDDEEVYKLFIFDEASSHASGYAKDASKVQQQLSSMVKLMRKNGGNIIIIGHTGKDVHADIRRLADYVQKTSKKSAVVYEDVHEGQGRKKKFEMKEIPPTPWSFDTNEESTWEWASGAAGGKDMTQIACEVYIAMKDGTRKTQKEVAEMFDISQSKISQNYQEYQES